jgi:GTP pyrophosphokinase
MGFVTRGRGVSIHRTDCANAVSLASAQNDRLIDAEWDSAMEADHFIASLEVKAYDRSHLLADVSRAFSDQHVNIINCATATTDDRIARLAFEFEIADPSHLQSLMRSLRSVDGVYDVYRVVPGGSRR